MQYSRRPTTHSLGGDYYKEGAQRGDGLSASYLARDIASEAQRFKGSKAAELNRSASHWYLVAFELGYVNAAQKAGDLLREIGDLAAARRAYMLGARLRDAGAALKLGKLELEVEQNEEAAHRAFRMAIRLDIEGAVASEALVGLGALLEKQ